MEPGNVPTLVEVGKIALIVGGFTVLAAGGILMYLITQKHSKHVS